MKKIIAIAAVLASTSAFAFMEDTNGNHSGGASATMNSDAKGRGVATFGMNFSASANTEANFDADGEGSMQNMFAGEGRDYYYNPAK